MAKSYIAYSGPAPTAAALPPIATGTAIKTLLQIASPANEDLTIIEWGISFDGTSGTPIRCELIQTDVAATVTAHIAAGVMTYNNPLGPPSLVTLGGAATGYNASAEGAPAVTRLLDYQQVSPAINWNHQFPQGREPVVPVSRFLRVRVTAAATVNAVAYVIWEE